MVLDKVDSKGRARNALHIFLSFFPLPFAFVFDQSRPPCRLLPFFFSLKPIVKIIKHLFFKKKNN